jgi:uncharacterized protein
MQGNGAPAWYPNQDQVAPNAPPRGQATSNRIVAIDALRGFALFGIVVVHMVEQYLAALQPPRSNFGIFSNADRTVQAIVTLLFIGKFFSMFSLLFGLSFFIQMERAARRGIDFHARFVWRLVLLLLIGVVHGLVYRGDILSIYAMLGLLLVLFYRASNRTLLVTALLLFVGLPRLLLAGISEAVNVPLSIVPGSAAAIEEYVNVLKSGSLLVIFASNVTEGVLMKLEFQFGVFGRGYQTFGLFLIGLYVGRHGWHESLPDLRRSLRRVAFGGLVTLLATSALFVLLASVGAIGRPETMGSWQITASLALYDIFNLSLTSILTVGFLLLYLRPGPQRTLRWLAPVGQTALTTYICQTLIGTFFYYGWGLNQLGETGAATAFLLAIILFAGQVIIANVWVRYFQFGPVEGLWRSLTFGRRQPFRRPAASIIAPVA